MLVNDRKTILAVDDDPDILRLVETILRRFGFNVLVARGADEALSIFKGLKRPPDLLLTDVIMPGVSGPILADRLTASEPNLRVLFMSGYDNMSIVERYVVKPGFPLLPKPFTFENLKSKVEEILAAPPTLLHDRTSL